MIRFNEPRVWLAGFPSLTAMLRMIMRYWNAHDIYMPSLCLDGPVTVGVSLDIASIDTISEINMVRWTVRPHTHTYDEIIYSIR